MKKNKIISGCDSGGPDILGSASDIPLILASDLFSQRQYRYFSG